VTKQPVQKQHCYLWQGISKAGNEVSGETYAANMALVKANLRSQGIKPIKVRKKPIRLFAISNKKIQSLDITIFTRQLATMLNAGIPLLQAIDLINRGQTNTRMQTLLNKIKQSLANGNTLAESLALHSKYFNHLYCSLIRVGEQSGSLDIILERMASYREKFETIKAQVKKALIYPTVVISAAIIVTMLLMVFVIPEFEELFSGFGAQLPMLTSLVIHIAHFLSQYSWLIFLLLGLCVTSIYYARLYIQPFADFYDKLLLKLPVIGSILEKAIIARFTRTLATTFAAGVPLIDALTSVASTVGNRLYYRAALQIRDEVATGQTLQMGLQSTNLFPNMVVQMVAIGEHSGTLEDMLNKISTLYEQQVDNSVANLSSLLEPFIIIILGIIVGGLVIAMFLPIFKLGSVVH
jgi:type IV pilus assembly protein PilC